MGHNRARDNRKARLRRRRRELERLTLKRVNLALALMGEIASNDYPGFVATLTAMAEAIGRMYEALQAFFRNLPQENPQWNNACTLQDAK